MKKGDVFPVLEPPPHGWQRLRARLLPQRQPWGWVAVASAAAVLLLLVVLVRPTDAADLTGALERELSGTEPVVARSENAAVVQLASSNPQVLLYRVSVLDPNEPP